MIYIENYEKGITDYPKRIVRCYIEKDFFAQLQCDKSGVPVSDDMKSLYFTYIRQNGDEVSNYIDHGNKSCYNIHIDDKTYTLDTILKNPELFCSLVEHENDLLALDTLS